MQSQLKKSWNFATHLRNQQNQLQHAKLQPDARILAIYQHKVWVENLPSAPQLINCPADFQPADEQLTFLGLDGQQPYFSFCLSDAQANKLLESHPNSTFTELKPIAPLLPAGDAELAALACFSSHWHQRHQFCGVCASPTTISDSGHQRQCSNDECDERYFPSMDPAVIMLVTKGDQCLLGRSSRWPDNMYSTLAGFVEPGETAEQAVAREVDEEVGIQVENVIYQDSQSWLFPYSLMLGFRATASHSQINYNPAEIEDARWFTRQQILAGEVDLPNPAAISYQLITAWLNEASSSQP